MIAGEKIFLRPISEDDLQQILKWNLDQELNRYVDNNRPSTLQECQAWYRSAKSDRYSQAFGISFYDGAGIIGEVELINITWRNRHAELRIRIGEKDLWNQGLGTETVRVFLGYIFHQLKLERVYLRVYSSNRRAIRCYQKSGFKFEGRLSRSEHMPESDDSILLMRILRDEYLRKEKKWRKEYGEQVG